MTTVHFSGVLSAVVTGLVIGGLGRLVVPGRQPIGCLLTVLVGIVGALVGTALALRLHVGWLLTVVLEVAVAAVLVVVLAGAWRRSG